MNAVLKTPLRPTVLAEADNAARYARCVQVSKRVRWEIDADVIRGRDFDYTRTFLPAGLSKADTLDFLNADQRRFFSQVQGRTYAYMFGLVERFIAPKMLQTSSQHWLGDQAALEALVRLSDEEIKHQELFRRLELLMDAGMPAGYTRVADANAVAAAVLGKRSWAVLALICHIELFVQSHYDNSIGPQADLCPLWKDVFLFHWKEECQHVIVDELEWRAEHRNLGAAERDAAVDDLIALVGAVDGILQMQAGADKDYFLAACGRTLSAEEAQRVGDTLLAAYRWQYIVSGVQHPRFSALLGEMTTPEQMQRIVTALGPILSA